LLSSIGVLVSVGSRSRRRQFASDAKFDVPKLLNKQLMSANAPLQRKSQPRRYLGIHRAVVIQRPPAAFERKAASTIATPAKPSSMVGKVTAGSMEEPVRRAMMHTATSL
jgi:hypothetical protein